MEDGLGYERPKFAGPLAHGVSDIWWFYHILFDAKKSTTRGSKHRIECPTVRDLKSREGIVRFFECTEINRYLSFWGYHALPAPTCSDLCYILCKCHQPKCMPLCMDRKSNLVKLCRMHVQMRSAHHSVCTQRRRHLLQRNPVSGAASPR